MAARSSLSTSAPSATSSSSSSPTTWTQPPSSLLALRARVEIERRRRARERADRPAPRATDFADDFVGFSRLLDILPRDGVRRKLEANPIQRALEAARTGRDIVLKPRQVGLTTWELARDLWCFLTRPGSRVVVVVQSITGNGPLRENSEKLRMMLQGLEAEGIRLLFRTETTSEWTLPSMDSSLRIVEAGASLAAAAKKGRSGTITRLHVTELAFFEHAAATLNAILECVPGRQYGSEIVIESTANGAAGTFYERYEAAKAGRSEYRAHFFRWQDEPEYRAELAPGELFAPETERELELHEKHGATLEQIKWYRSKVADKGSDLVDQEYPLDEERAWLVAGRMFFEKTVLEKLLRGTRDPIRVERGELSVWKDPEPGKVYVVVVDPSEGVGGDPGAALVLERATGEHVATLHGQFQPTLLADKVADLGRRYNTALVVVERTNHGHGVIAALGRGASEGEAEKYPRVYRGKDTRQGWNPTEASRSSALDSLEGAMRKGHWTTPDRRVLAEMLTFVVNKDGKAEAASGAHDDLVMAAAIGYDVVSKPFAVVRATKHPVHSHGAIDGSGTY